MDLIDAILQADKPAAEAPLRAWRVHDWGVAYDNLRRLAEGALPWETGELIEALAPLMAENADPDRALNNLERYAQVATGPLRPVSLARERPFLLGLIVGLFGFSQFMSDALIRHPFYVGWLGEEGALERGLDPGEIRRSLAESMSPFSTAEMRHRSAVRWLRQQLVRLGAQVMLGVIDEDSLTRCLSEQAAALCELAIAEARAELKPKFGDPIEETGDGANAASAAPAARAAKGRPAKFCIIAMGKFGAGELNFSSDIDLMFIYSAEGRTTGSGRPGEVAGHGAISNHDYFGRLAERVGAFLGSSNAEGYLYRVDTRLRPDGIDGPLARSLASFEIYHETQARLWERMALLKARAVAGDAPLCREFDAMSRALVFDRVLDRDVVRQVRELKDMIDGAVGSGPRGEREIKRGEGGIREIEFLAQTCQLLDGSRHPALRARGTLEAIDALRGVGRFKPDEADTIKADYRFLRVLEHRLQMMDLRQTHTIPSDPDEVERVARRCGLASGDDLMRRWREIRARVNKRFVEFFGPPGGGASDAPGAAAADLPPAARAARALMTGGTEKELAPLLLPFGLESPGAIGSLKRLAGLGRSVYLTERGRGLFTEIAPDLIEAAGASARPAVALSRLDSFLQASGSFASLFEVFRSNPNLMRWIVDAFGRAGFVAAALTAHPEYTDYLLDPAGLSATPSRREILRRVKRWSKRAAGTGATAISGARSTASNEPPPREARAEFAAALARVRRFESLACAMAEIGGVIGFEAARERLSLVADVLTQAALSGHADADGWDLNTMGAAGDASGPPAGIIALAMGKLGSREMNYYSDLDLVFARDDRPGRAAGGLTDAAAAAELASGAIETLTRAGADGAVYNVDARLRPEGANAPLCPPFSRYLDYYAARADLWEWQSWMRIRPIAGDPAAGSALVADVAEIIRGRLLKMDWRADVVEAMRRMRRRIEDAAKTPSWVMCDFKKGYGGVIDLEFLAQLHQLRALKDGTSLIGARPDRVFEAAGASGALSTEDAAGLADDYVAMRLLESRSRLLFETEKSHIPAGGEKLESLARVMGDAAPAGAEAFRDWLNAILRRNRARFDRLMA